MQTRPGMRNHRVLLLLLLAGCAEIDVPPSSPANVQVRDADRRDQPAPSPLLPPAVPSIAPPVAIDEGFVGFVRRDEPMFFAVEAHGLPALSSDRLTYVAFEEEGGDSLGAIVVRDVRTSAIRERIDTPDDVAAMRAVNARLTGYAPLQPLAPEGEWAPSHYEDVGDSFEGEGLAAFARGSSAIVVDIESGDTRVRVPLRSHYAEELEGTVTESVYGAWLAPDGSFVVLEIGACGCWCTVDPTFQAFSLGPRA